jgi:hypothetical protein
MYIETLCAFGYCRRVAASTSVKNPVLTGLLSVFSHPLSIDTLHSDVSRNKLSKNLALIAPSLYATFTA